MNKANMIWDEQQCKEAYDELMIKIAMSSYAKIEGQELLEENEHLKKLSQFQATTKIEKDIRRIVEKETLRNSVYIFGKGFYSVTSKVAMVFLALSVLFSTTMVASANVRSAVYKLIFTYEKQYTLIELDSNTDLEFVNSDVYAWSGAFAPTMMPQGYVASEVINATFSSRVTYENENGGYIDFVQSNSDATTTMQVDTENAQLVRTVLINDSDGLLVSKDGIAQLVWSVGGRFLRPESDSEDAETLISIAKDIKLLR